MDLRKIKKLIDLLEESNLAEIEIKEGEESVRLARVPKGAMIAAAPAPMVQHVESRPAAPMPMSSPTEASTGGTAKPTSNLPEGHVVRAPMVGTFYLSPSPDKPALVTLGHQVNAGETHAINEDQKILNPHKTHVSGTVKAVLTENGQPVEFDQPLFVIA